MKLKITFFIIAVFSIAYGQEVKYNITDIMQIGNNKESVEYYFENIQKISFDSKMNIYILDWKGGSRYGNTALIRQFSPKGVFLKTIGKNGEGPGDFNTVTDFLITKDDMLLILDRVNQRLSIYDIAKNEFKEFVKTNNLNESSRLYPYNNDMLLFENCDYSNTNRNTLYLRSFDFKNTFYDFGHTSLFFKDNDEDLKMKLYYGRPPLLIHVITEDKIIAAPYFYDGELMILTRENNVWKNKIVPGSKPLHQALERNQSNVARTGPGDFHVGSGAGSGGGYKQHSKSQRLLPYKGKYILHFYIACRHPGSLCSYVDIFDYNGKLLGSKMLNRFQPEMPPQPMVNIIAADDQGNFYGSTRVDGVLVVKKVKLDIGF